MEKLNTGFLEEIIQRIINKKNIKSAVMRVENGDGSFCRTCVAGDMHQDSRYFIASVTKLYITVVVMLLVDENKLSLDDSIEKYLPAELIKGLHIFKGIDYSAKITIKHLISNNSGIPDYFFHRQSDGKTAADMLLEGNDEPWYLDKTLEVVKRLKPKFMPGAKRKAAYSDTNYQLLGRIIETITGKSVGEVFKESIFDVLGLRNTYAYQDIMDTSPVPFYYKSRKLWLPEYISSITPEGGIISTAEENMVFLKAFFQGKFFQKEAIENLKQWNVIYPPPGLFLFGIGLEKIWVPRIVSLRKPITEILGFWGQTGSFAWYNSDTDLYFCGTTNQIDGSGHAAVTSAIIKIIKKVLNKGLTRIIQ